jgi:hypothetical protein
MKIIELVAFLAWTSLATAMFVRPTAVPVERLEQKAAEYTKAHPEDANGWYTFARIHYLAFILNSDSLNGWEEPNGGMPHLHHEQKPEPAGLPKESDPQLAVRHVAAALQYFDKAIALQKDNALFLLGKASLLDQYMDAAWQNAIKKVDPKPAPVTPEQIIELYLKAFDAAKSKDKAQTRLPLLGLQELVSHEAGTAYLKKAPQGSRAAEVTAHLAKLKELKMGVITPIISADAVTLDQLFDGHTATFDLTGLGWTKAYPWPVSQAAFLVWDPQQTGNIANGKQLFGFYTWGIFWQNGYQALSMLDDNSDAVLTGQELDGIALWTDANRNGYSDAGEVVSAKDRGVTSIRVQADFSEGIHPVSLNGLRFKDAPAWNTWDWMAEPVAP